MYAEVVCDVIAYYNVQMERVSSSEALNHVFVRDGRLRYHTSLCRCCWLSAGGMSHQECEFEPVPETVFEDGYEATLHTVQDVRGRQLE